MTLSDQHISEIAELLDCGLICFYHRPTATIQSHPDTNDPHFDPEPWQEVINKIENDQNNYDKFEKMNSNEGYRVIENFAHSLTDINFRDRILDRLSIRRPFQGFKHLIDSSDHLQEWFDFKKNAYIDFVKRQIKSS